MANIDRIDSLADVPKVVGELNTIAAQLRTLKGEIVGLGKFEGFGKGGGASIKELTQANNELNESMKRGKTVTDQLVASKIKEEQLAKATAQRELAEAKLRDANAKAAEREAAAIAKSTKAKVEDGGSRQGVADGPVDTAALNARNEALRQQAILEAEAAGAVGAGTEARHKSTAATKEVTQAADLELDALENNIVVRDRLQKNIKEVQASLKDDAAALKSGTISRSEYNKRLAQGNIEIDASKKKVKELTTEIKRQSATTEEQRKATADASNTYKQLSIAYQEAALRAKNYNLELGKNHPLTIQATRDAKVMSDKLKEVDGSVGQAQRNVGNYGSAFSRAFGAIRTAANILPGIGIAGIFGLIFTGLEKLTSSLVNTAKKFNEVKAAQEGLFEAMGGTEYTSAIASVKTLGIEIDLAKRGFIDKADVLKQYNETIGLTTGQVTSLDEAEKALVKNAEAYIRFTLLKAAATLIQQKAAKELVEAEEQNQKDLARISKIRTDDGSDGLGDFIKRGEENLRYSEQEAAKKRVAGLNKIGEKFLTEAAELSKKFNFNFFADKPGDANKGAAAAKKRIEDERKAQLELFKYRQQLLIDEQKARVAAFTGNSRDSARTKQAELEKELIQGVANFELKQADLTASERILIEEKKNADIVNINNGRLNDIRVFALQEQQILLAAADATSDQLAAIGAAAEKKRQSEELESRVKFFQNALEAQLNQAEVENRATRVALSQQYASGKISKEEYEEQLFQIEIDYRRKALEIQIKYYRNLAFVSGISAEEQAKYIKKLDDLQKELDEAGIKRAEATKEKKVKLAKEERDAILALSLELQGLTTDLLTGGIERQKNAIAELIDTLEDQKQKDIEVANQTIVNATERAAAISVIEARANAEKQQLEQRQRRLDQQKARYEKAAAVASIIQNTAVAFTAALSRGPIYAALIAALGAAQLVRALAAPIPKYAEGIFGDESHPGGKAWVGDGGRREVVVEPGGRTYLTPSTATLVDLKKGSMVYPDINTYQKHAHTGVPTFGAANTTATDMRGVERRLDKLVKNSRPRPAMRPEVNLSDAIRFRDYLNKTL